MTCFSCIFGQKEASWEQGILTSEEIPGIQNVTLYSYKELKNATEDFSDTNKIGEGGYGSVYKGRLKDGKFVAIKVLSSNSRQGSREFLSELATIANIVHENLVKLYGCCIEGNHRILVYNYLANNSLSHTLLGGRCSAIQFDWRTRTKICIGVARGLAYLHEEVQPRIVHRDIKASNILLDSDLNPKISDFGLAKLLPSNTTHVSTRVAGTLGYLAPEYALRGQLTRRADIYSFGVLLLEIISGRCNTNTRIPVEDQFLLAREIEKKIRKIKKEENRTWKQAWVLYERNELVFIVDSDLNGDFDAEEACRFLKVSLLCTQDNPKLRPPMSAVVQMLTGEKDVNPETITKPGLILECMNLKIGQKKAEVITSTNTMSSGLSAHDNSPLFSENNTHTSNTSAAICDRDD